jgi:hypothetical protein
LVIIIRDQWIRMKYARFADYRSLITLQSSPLSPSGDTIFFYLTESFSGKLCRRRQMDTTLCAESGLRRRREA